jgi:hypothetical protein
MLLPSTVEQANDFPARQSQKPSKKEVPNETWPTRPTLRRSTNRSHVNNSVDRQDTAESTTATHSLLTMGTVEITRPHSELGSDEIG